MTADKLTYRLPPIATWVFIFLGAVGLLALAAGLFLAPNRTWANLFLVSNYVAGLGLGSLLLVALHYVTGARWSMAIRRIPEAMTAVLPLAAIGILAVLLCRSSIYGWSLADVVDTYESPLHRLWLNRPFFLIRSIVYLAVWLAFAFAIVRNSRKQDKDAFAAAYRKTVTLSAFFLVVFGITFWMASCDWLMSLEPEWTSTIFAVYNFSGALLSGLAAVTLLILWLGRRAPLQTVLTKQHYHDLGTIMFGLSCFWMYTWFCQYMLIWYVNNPEETVYYLKRSRGDWPFVVLLDLVLNWGVPFAVLLFRAAKRSPLILGTVAVSILIGRGVDLFLMVQPSQGPEVPIPGWIEAGLIFGVVGLVALVFFRGLSQSSLVPPESSHAAD